MKQATIEAAARGLWSRVGRYDIHTDVEAAVADAVRNVAQAQAVADWLSCRGFTKTPRPAPRTASYAVKHEIEAACGHWVCHTVFLAIAFNAGVLFGPAPIVRANGLIEFHTNISSKGCR